MAKTLHVVPARDRWAVRRIGRKTADVFPTKGEAIKGAKALVRSDNGGQVVVHGRDGRIQQQHTYGMPRVQDPPDGKSRRIAKAVKKVVNDRLSADPLPTRG